MKDNSEKEANGNKRLVTTMAILFIVLGIIGMISVLIGGAVKDFCSTAIPGVEIALGIAFMLAYNSKKE